MIVNLAVLLQNSAVCLREFDSNCIRIDALCRILYWTDVNRNDPTIYRSSVVNPFRETLVSGNLVWPTALAIDFTGKQAANTRV